MPSIATSFAMLKRIQSASSAALYNPLDLDLIQIATEGDDTVISVNFAGVVTLVPSTHTNGTLFGRYFAATTSLTMTVAQYFALAFTNPQQYDILQMISGAGGGIVWHLDYLGVSYTP